MKTRPDDSFRVFVLDQLSELPGLVCRPMFGGYGLYTNDRFFGILHCGNLYFKTDAHTVLAYQAAGMPPFRPNEKQTLKRYYQVPIDILEDAETLTLWASTAAEFS